MSAVQHGVQHKSFHRGNNKREHQELQLISNFFWNEVARKCIRMISMVEGWEAKLSMMDALAMKSWVWKDVEHQGTRAMAAMLSLWAGYWNSPSIFMRNTLESWKAEHIICWTLFDIDCKDQKPWKKCQHFLASECVAAWASLKVMTRH